MPDTPEVEENVIVSPTGGHWLRTSFWPMWIVGLWTHSPSVANESTAPSVAKLPSFPWLAKCSCWRIEGRFKTELEAIRWINRHLENRGYTPKFPDPTGAEIGEQSHTPAEHQGRKGR